MHVHTTFVCWSAEEVLLLRRGNFVTPHSNKNSNVLNRCPAERFLFVVGATYIYSGSNNKRESDNK